MDIRLRPTKRSAKQWLEVLDSIPATEQQRACLFQVDQTGTPALRLFLEEDVFGVEAAVNLPSVVQLPGEQPSRLQDCLALIDTL